MSRIRLFTFGLTLASLLLLALPLQSVLAQGPPSSHYTGVVTATTCSGSSYEFRLAIQNNILAGQSTITTFSVAGVVQPSGTFIEEGPYTDFNPSYGVGPGVAFAYPAGTVVASQVDSYDGPGGTGNLAYTSRIEWVCDTGVVLSLSNNPVGSQTSEPGCDIRLGIPAGSVVGAFVADAQAYSAPGVLTSPVVTLQAGKTAWVIGQDASGQYYKINWACSHLWVPVGTMGPNYDEVWNGTPLPTSVVE